LGFGTGFVAATGFPFAFDTGLVGTRLVFLFGTAFVGAGSLFFGARFVGSGRFLFGVRFVRATSFVFRFGFVPLTGFAGATGFPFVFVARLFGRGAATDFRCAALTSR
jgi:hypothetical protein